ncbi:MAG: PLP-dependent aminotransferase family protein [Marinobacterium sp.]|nr:PLP-dependent aminotransferase family protein [Marinobacterium sp.]
MSEFLYLQLEQEFSAAIQAGRWQAGDRLPSVRALCRERELSKATVLHAYNRLEARGLVEARPKAGYFVRLQHRGSEAGVGKSDDFTADTPPALVTVPALIGDIMRRGAAFDILPDTDRRTDMPPGIVELNRAVARALRHQRGLQHQYYDDPRGVTALREQLMRRYQRRGCLFDAEQVSITAGCQHALFLALMACCDAGDIVAVESPGFYGVIQLAESLGLKILEIPASTDTGMDMDGLERALQSWQVKAVVVTPAFATPSGSLMPQAARARLLALAEQYDLVVIEDDIYADLAFGTTPSPLKALDHNDRVILCGSVSKSLSRDLRLGWIVAGRWQQKIEQIKLVNMLAGNRFIEQGVADFIADGGYDRHLRRLRLQLQDQRDQLVQMLSEWSLPVRISQPEGGLCLWLELPESVDTLAVYQQARHAGVVITPGALFTSRASYRNCLRLSFAHPWHKRRREALSLLGTLLLEA